MVLHRDTECVKTMDQKIAKMREWQCRMVRSTSLKPHHFCSTDYETPDPAMTEFYYDHETMRLTLLRSCRQIYVEANAILWTTNTFSFANFIPLKRSMIDGTFIKSV